MSYAFTRGNFFHQPQVFWNETLYIKLYEMLVFFDGTWLSLLTLQNRLCLVLLTSEEWFYYCSHKCTWLARNWLNSFDFVIQNKTAGKQSFCLVACCVTYQLNKHVLTGIFWISSCKTQSNEEYLSCEEFCKKNLWKIVKNEIIYPSKGTRRNKPNLSDLPVGREKRKDLSQFTQLHVRKNPENGPAQVLTRLSHCARKYLGLKETD